MAALDARKAEVYWGCYKGEGGGTVSLQGSEYVCAPAAVPGPEGNDWIGAGSGWEAHGDELMKHIGEQVVRVLPDFEPHAADVARLGSHAYRQGETVSPEAAVPVYLRNKVAEVKKSLRQ
jgi:tRNA threonylcarbamoyladenosine biosynthesis protein TsaB